MAGVVQLAEHFKKGESSSWSSTTTARAISARCTTTSGCAKGFFEVTGMTARDLVAMGVSAELFAVEASRPVEDAVRLMGEHDFSQISVTKSGRIIGSLNESHLRRVHPRAELQAEPVETIMQPAFPFVDISTPVEAISTMITPENPAVLVRDFKTDKTFIITRSDIIRVMM